MASFAHLMWKTDRKILVREGKFLICDQWRQRHIIRDTPERSVSVEFLEVTVVCYTVLKIRHEPVQNMSMSDERKGFDLGSIFHMKEDR